MTNFSTIELLLSRYTAGTATEAEVGELATILQENSNDPAIQAQLEKMAMATEWPYPMVNEQLEEILQRILKPRKVRRMAVWKRVAVAAALIGALICCYKFFLEGRNKKNNPTKELASQSERFKNDVAPGSYRAKLVLADGKEVLLDQSTPVELGSQGNVIISQQNGELRYQEDQQNGSTKSASMINTLATARGETFSTILSDGTRIWLNSASSITYPVSFAAGKRTVSITGEAYFEVAHVSQLKPGAAPPPFVVKANGVEVHDLGTSFNINAYSDEVTVNTTLIEGKAEVRKGGAKQLLIPGQQAQVSSAGKINVLNNADVDRAVAWKYGLFNFEGTGLGELLRQLQRWYDLQVEFEPGVPDVQFFGKLNRNVKLSTVLEALKGMGIHFRIEAGNRLIVTK